MTPQERAIARIIFKNRVLSFDGQAYENLFTVIMGYANDKFVQIKPQGQVGDRKNDGYDHTAGHYYQVFAPEDRELSEAKAVTKLKSDFAGLKKYWQKTCPINGFRFVFNDKYKGSFPTIETDLVSWFSVNRNWWTLELAS